MSVRPRGDGGRPLGRHGLQETHVPADRTGMVALRRHVLALAAAALTIVLALVISEPQLVTSTILG